MTNHITITVPRDDNDALVAGATMLLTLAGKVSPIDLDDVAGDTAPPAGTMPPPPSAGSAGAPAGQDNTTQTGPASDGAAAGASPSETAAPAGVEVDANGLPWDARIHTGTKSKNKDDTWRYKSGIDRDTLVPEVEAELRALMAVPAGGDMPPPPGTAAGVQTTSQSEATPPAGATEQMNNPDPEPNLDNPENWPDFLKAVSAKIQQQQITMDGVTAIVNGHGIASLQLLGSRPDLIPLVWAQVQEACGNG